jgi:hypothetical protein
MTADSVNRWLTLLANVGVVIGLVLLLIELDQNNDLARAQIHQDRSDAWVANRFARADSGLALPATLKFVEAGFPDDLSAMEKLTPIEAARMRDVLSAFQGDYDNLFYQYQNGYLDDEYYRYMIEPSIRTLAPWWKKYETPGRPSFEKEVERILAGN